MADNGITGIAAGASAPAPSRRGARTAPTGTQASASAKRSTESAANGRIPGQTITLDGRSYDKTAPRGTYIDILV